MGLCLPRRRRANSLAKRPSVLLLASTRYQSRFTVSALALIVFMGNPVAAAGVNRNERTDKYMGTLEMPQVCLTNTAVPAESAGDAHNSSIRRQRCGRALSAAAPAGRAV